MSLHDPEVTPRCIAPRRSRSLCGDCYLEGICARAKVTVPGLGTIRTTATRLTYQNYLVRLRMPYRALIDYHLDALRDFVGGFEDENGNAVPAPGIASFLTPGAEFWFREQIASGQWRTIGDVPRLRSEAVGRWRIIGTVIDIKETIQPICPGR